MNVDRANADISCRMAQVARCKADQARHCSSLVGALPDIASIVVLPATPLATDPGLALLPAAFSVFPIAATMASPPVETATRRFMHSANDASPAQQAGERARSKAS